MFGYVRPHPADLYVREYEFYKAAYCGLCRAMRKETGQLSRLTLSYDLLLLALVRMLYLPVDDPTLIRSRRRRCIAHPLRRRPMLETNPALDYAARVSALLSYYKVRDDRVDARGFRRLLAAAATPVVACARRRADLPALDRLIRESLDRLAELEADDAASVDEPAEVFGGMLGEVFAWDLPPRDAVVARAFGRGLGRFIYVADAAEDYPEDVRRDRYNPYRRVCGDRAWTDADRASVRTALLLELSGVERAMNLLPREGRDALIHLIENTVCEGIPRRLDSFLPAVDPADAAPDSADDPPSAASVDDPA
ncbi:MAG: hypothetical protein J6125_03735 [Clostridia bacterium]|nr:hypothetical protein [Clostridia bacterium]